MADLEAVRRIARALPETSEGEGDQFGVSVRNGAKHKGFAWTWMERIEPKKPRVPNDGVLAVRVANESEKQMLLDSDPAKFFTEPHYNGFPAILVRLDAIGAEELEELLIDAWRTQAPKKLVKEWDARAI